MVALIRRAFPVVFGSPIMSRSGAASLSRDRRFHLRAKWIVIVFGQPSAGLLDALHEGQHWRTPLIRRRDHIVE
jgi:hypothetical protein